MRKILYTAVFAGISLLCMAVLVQPARAGDVRRISKEEVKKKLCSPNFAVLDVRVTKNWASSTQKIKCAKRMDPDAVSNWADSLQKNMELVLYCS